MKSLIKKCGAVAVSVGLVGAVAAACAACCISIPIVGTLLAGFAITGLGALGNAWHVAWAGLLVLGALAIYLAKRRRQTCASAATNSCSCSNIRIE